LAWFFGSTENIFDCERADLPLSGKHLHLSADRSTRSLTTFCAPPQFGTPRKRRTRD
jgi:hypothetical protein